MPNPSPILAASRAVLAAWDAAPLIRRIPEDVAVAGMVPRPCAALVAARELLPPLLACAARNAEALLIAGGLDPAAEPRDIEAARRAVAHLGDRWLRRSLTCAGAGTHAGQIAAESAHLYRDLVTRAASLER